MKKLCVDYNFTRISSGRLPDLLGIFKSAFGRAPALDDLEKKHDTSFAGARDMGFVAYSEGAEPAAFYGVFPVVARIDGQDHCVAQSGDTMVAKAHEGKGLFTRLAQVTYEQAASEGIKGVFGFPSPSSYPGFVRRLNWQHHDNIQRFAFAVPTVPISELSWRWGPSRTIMRAWQRLLLRLFSRGAYFDGPLMRNGGDCVSRTPAYWYYKLANPDVAAIRVAGVDVIIKLEGSLGIGDVNSTDPAVLRRVVARLRLFCLFAGIGRIRTYLSPNGPLALAFRAIVTPREGLAIGYLDLSPSLSLGRLEYCYLDMDSF